jgi:hypothetical protein
LNEHDVNRRQVHRRTYVFAFALHLVLLQHLLTKGFFLSAPPFGLLLFPLCLEIETVVRTEASVTGVRVIVIVLRILFVWKILGATCSLLSLLLSYSTSACLFLCEGEPGRILIGEHVVEVRSREHLSEVTDIVGAIYIYIADSNSLYFRDLSNIFSSSHSTDWQNQREIARTTRDHSL